ncbi:right-handed parallel beta-helix repeat-containing protein [Pseudenhygromyxa sp. WMMC2535]|uniref:carbohydrate-binding protein n=1 Tax=Pseudenhygromyxa sp. WMMC2535 TaxID=2712867 RepID=UPI001555B92F|nr:carbohydrate-binding protein [Pseudenhygromyxa sp. WMMC2535]NVB41514.1 right-handed parallel beta-helix repeat-containing protein [Pseudenhygromyxa sp. WMMC2535]
MAGVYREQVELPRSGEAGAPITFAVYEDDEVVVTTTELVGGWAPVDGDLQVATLDDPEATRRTMTIFVDGEWVNEAHWSPMGENVSLLRSAEFPTIDAYTATTITDAALVGLELDIVGAQIGVQANSWSLRFRTIVDFDAATGTVTFDEAVDFSAVEDKNYIIYAALDVLDAPGEWYFDEDSRELFMMAPAGKDLATAAVEIKTRSDCFVLGGHDYIEFRGFELRGGDLDMGGSSHVSIEGVKIRFPDWNYGVGGDGLVSPSLVFDGSDNLLRDSEIEGICEQLITSRGADNRVINNLFHDGGYNNTDGAAIVLDACDEGNLISHNSFRNFAHSVISGGAGYHFVIQYNEFEAACQLTADVGAVGFGNSSYNNSVVHHNVFHAMPAMSAGVYMDALSADIVIHHNLMYDSAAWGLKINLPNTNILVYSNTIYGVGTIDAASSTENLSADETYFYNNIYSHMSTRLVDGGAFVEGNLVVPDDAPYVDATNLDFRLRDDAEAIDIGVELPGITDGFTGAAPDAGALERGESMWVYGHDFDDPPQPEYSWTLLPHANPVANGSFENELAYWEVAAGEPLAATVNVWNYKDEALGISGSRALRLDAGDELTQVVTGLRPNQDYQLRARARVVGPDIQMESASESSAGYEAEHFGSEYSYYGLSAGQWFRFDEVDFGADTPRYDELQLGVSHDSDISVEFRLDDPAGALIASGSHVANVDAVRWHMIKSPLADTTGTHALYLVVNAATSTSHIDRIRLIDTGASSKVTLRVTGFDGADSVASASIGAASWSEPEFVSFTTGDDPGEIGVSSSMAAGSELTGYVEAVGIREQ